VHVTCRNNHRYCYYCVRPFERHRRYAGELCVGNQRERGGCPQYLTSRVTGSNPLANGFVFDNDGYVATQEFAVQKAKMMLKAYMERIGAAAFRAAVASAPGLLSDFAPHDGRDQAGNREHAPVPSVTLSVDDIEATRSHYPRRKTGWVMMETSLASAGL